MQGDESAQKGALYALRHAKGYIQSEIASNLQLKSTPSLTFYLDEGKRKSGHVLELIEKAVKEDNIAGNRGGENMKKLSFGLPKGSLQESTIGMMKNAGYKVYVSIQGDESAQKGALYALRHAKGYIQSEIASNLQLK
ncbi:MAG: ribosome-binding factor A, partial [Planctomycetota bacterium]